MNKKIIPIMDHRRLDVDAAADRRPVVATAEPASVSALPDVVTDKLDRPLRDLRISVTDRCNFRCVYCMPKEVFDHRYTYLPQDALLSFEEIVRIAKLFIARGVRKIRLTGGEPLLRKNIERLVAMLSTLRTIDGDSLELTLTTNGSLLAKKAHALKDAGLTRLTVSLDALDDTLFRKMNDVDFAVADVLRGLDAAHQAGFTHTKVNMVVKGGTNDSQILTMARYFKDSPFILRYIEYMDVGSSNGWKLDEVIPSAEVIRRIHQEFPLRAIAPNYDGETAARWRYVDGGGEIGVISSVTQAFCQSCTRARLSTEGKLFTCLFGTQGYDLRTLLRRGDTDDELSTVIARLWRARSDRYSEMRTAMTSVAVPLRKVEMSYIGG
ncbi:GTP 3',8-cyclase MoaA [Noviherbaspirillum saxi]|uniref:GTP 3',8-cyclase n=1 Tax=Noviherbaspirillum saxi TaxID=2320863 RepID=A0A3A3FHS0_9BURK|nr:GTP 3',8-cyclase MoaA [Noviherbaspirillum saxi]RJF92697.1 GTP 3',8-cyclase MoaA [Noviherbaspirillum saxi]